MVARRIPVQVGASLVFGLVMSGCTTITEFDVAGDGSSSSGASSTGPLLPSSPLPPVDPSTSSSSGLDPEPSSSSAGDGCDSAGGFLNIDSLPDVPPVEMCNLWDDDCPRGEKCNIWANDGGFMWKASRCVPLAPDPAGPGEPCTAQDSATSGFDDCDVASVCLVSDFDTLRPAKKTLACADKRPLAER